VATFVAAARKMVTPKADPLKAHKRYNADPADKVLAAAIEKASRSTLRAALEAAHATGWAP
jgi:hypothetical protein